MQRPLPALDVDLLIEHGGHSLNLSGSGASFVANFPTLRSLFYFLCIVWRFRKRVPRDVSLQVSWRQFRVQVKRIV